MEIVLAHNNSDFDSLAAQFAVTKLFPATKLVPGHPLAANIRSFLSLYRDSIPIVDLQYLEVEKVKHIFLVDCQHAERLDDIARKLIEEKRVPYTIFDHHQLDENGLGPNAREDSIIKPMGAATTLVVDQLRQRNVTLTPFEATLLAIGIYEDTGSLTYSGTKETDALCVAYLLKHGADLSQVHNFTNPKLNEEQTALFQNLVRNSRMIQVSGVSVLIAHGTHPRYLEGLATMTRRLLEVTAAEAALSVVHMRDRTHIVGRSDNATVNVRNICQRFGGDGHPGAASAVSKDLPVPQIIAEIETALRAETKPEVVAGDIMTAPVITIPPETPMDEAGRIMLRYGQSGLVVTGKQPVEGVVSRRDIDKAIHHKLSHAPVTGFMSRPVFTIKETTPLSEIQQLMVKEDIGRLPVVSTTGELLGIVDRKDVLRKLYGYGTASDGDQNFPGSFASEKHFHLRDKIKQLDDSTKWLFETVGSVAADRNMSAYAVGGCVRDLIMGRENFDLDFVIEGSAIDLAYAMETAYPSRFAVQRTHERFQTATLTFIGAVKRDIDFTTARTEFYEKPAALPTVEASRLEQDLFRRDFTINALALSLVPDRFGDLVDFFGGIDDINSKQVRILHQFSFIEDPTRIIRAVRFATRLGFSLEPRTRSQAERAIALGIFDSLGDHRLKEELKLILESDHRKEGLELLRDLGGGLVYLAPELNYDRKTRVLLRRAERLFKRYSLEHRWIIYLALLLAPLNESELEAAINRLYLSNDEKDWIKKGLKLPPTFSAAGKPSPSKVYEELHGVADHSLAIAACLAEPGSILRRSIKLYLDKLRHVHVSVTGSDLIKLGIPQGPQIKDALSKLHMARLDGMVDSATDELAFLRKHYPNLKASAFD